MINPVARQPASAPVENGNLVELNDVCKFYRMGGSRVRALDGVTLSIARGSFWAVMGPSGSGKSTLLNLLGCLDRPDAGTYTLAGRDVAHMDDDALSELRLQKIGFIFQSFNLIAQLTVRENIELPLFYMDWPPNQSARRARDLADMVGLGDRLDHRPAELSGGQQQRVAIARALANDPELLLADEPTGNLDSTTGQQIMALLTGLHREGKTIILVTHDPETAAGAAHRLVVQDGCVLRVEDRG
jgi:putative ABC transport system ATP-binding protein